MRLHTVKSSSTFKSHCFLLEFLGALKKYKNKLMKQLEQHKLVYGGVIRSSTHTHLEKNARTNHRGLDEQQIGATRTQQQQQGEPCNHAAYRSRTDCRVLLSCLLRLLPAPSERASVAASFRYRAVGRAFSSIPLSPLSLFLSFSRLSLFARLFVVAIETSTQRFDCTLELNRNQALDFSLEVFQTGPAESQITNVEQDRRQFLTAAADGP